jgi:predicted MFS family arabinose efflux permease
VAAVVFGAVFARHGTESRPGKFDVAGFALSGAGLGLLMYGVSEGPVAGWDSPVVLGAVVAGAVLLPLMVRVELRTAEPMVAVRLLGNRQFRSGTVVNVLMAAGFIGTLYAMSLYLQDGRGMGTLAAGLTIFPEALGMAAGYYVASRVLYRRLGPRLQTAVGTTCLAASISLLALLGPHSSLWWVRLLMFAAGLGMAQAYIAAQTVSFATIPAAATGRASTLFNSARQLGAAVGVALLTTVIGVVGTSPLTSGHAGANLIAYRTALGTAAVFCLAGLPFALSIRDADAAATIPGRSPRKSVSPPR